MSCKLKLIWKLKLTLFRTQEELKQRLESQDLQIQSYLRRLDEMKTRCRLLDCLTQAQEEAAIFGQSAYDAYGTVSTSGTDLRSRHGQYIPQRLDLLDFQASLMNPHRSTVRPRVQFHRYIPVMQTSSVSLCW